MKKLSENMKFKYLVVTRGNWICLLFNRKNKKFYNSKAYSYIDRRQDRRWRYNALNFSYMFIKK